MVEAATEFRKNGFNDEDAAQLGQIATWIQVEYMATYIKNRVNCWKESKGKHYNARMKYT